MEWAIPAVIILVPFSAMTILVLILVFTNPTKYFGEPETIIKEIVPQGTVSIDKYNALMNQLKQQFGSPDWRKIIDPKYAERFYLEYGYIPEHGVWDITRWGGGWDILEARNAFQMIRNQHQELKNTSAPLITMNNEWGLNAVTEVTQLSISVQGVSLWGVVQSLAQHTGETNYLRYVRIYLSSEHNDLMRVNQLIGTDPQNFAFPETEDQIYSNEFIDAVLEEVPADRFINPAYYNQQRPAIQPMPVYQPTPQYQPVAQGYQAQPVYGGQYLQPSPQFQGGGQMPASHEYDYVQKANQIRNSPLPQQIFGQPYRTGY